MPNPAVGKAKRGFSPGLRPIFLVRSPAHRLHTRLVGDYNCLKYKTGIRGRGLDKRTLTVAARGTITEPLRVRACNGPNRQWLVRAVRSAAADDRAAGR